SSVRHIVPPRATLFLRRRAHIAPRICFLLLDVRQSAHRGLIGVVGFLLESPFLLKLRFFFIAHALGRRRVLRIGRRGLHQERGCAHHDQERERGTFRFFIGPDGGR